MTEEDWTYEILRQDRPHFLKLIITFKGISEEAIIELNAGDPSNQIAEAFETMAIRLENRILAEEQEAKLKQGADND